MDLSYCPSSRRGEHQKRFEWNFISRDGHLLLVERKAPPAPDRFSHKMEETGPEFPPKGKFLPRMVRTGVFPKAFPISHLTFCGFSGLPASNFKIEVKLGPSRWCPAIFVSSPRDKLSSSWPFNETSTPPKVTNFYVFLFVSKLNSFQTPCNYSKIVKDETEISREEDEEVWFMAFVKNPTWNFP